MNNMRQSISAYLELTKPSIMLLVLFTGATSLVVEGSLLSDPLRFALVLIGLYLTGGSANGLNQYFERRVDAQMKRTYKRRPLPLGKISPQKALVFSVTIGMLGVVLFFYFFNLLTGLLSLATILFYSLFYTLWLKPNTDQNIVIGGVAGAMAPVGAWTAATGTFDIVPWILFAIVFFWTPPHFWALALFCREDYEKTGLPMMPVTRGDRATLKQIVVYSLVLFIVSLSLLAFGGGWFYLTVAVLMGGALVRKAVYAFKAPRREMLRALFGFSIVYLFAVFSAVIVDSFFSWPVFGR